MGNGIVHIYAQYAQHMAAIILGNEAGLIALRDAINEAIYPGKIKSGVDVFCNDGGGYTVYIKVLADTDKLPMPFAADYAQDKTEKKLPGDIYNE